MQKHNLTSNYIGRFAPSPTGHLHFGSYVTALASYLRAKSKNGKWILRIEDLDQNRCKKEFTYSILKTLEDFNLIWDYDIVYQSQRNEIYKEYFEILKEKKLIYNCFCSRKRLLNLSKNKNTNEYIYDKYCLKNTETMSNQYSCRLLIDKDSNIIFDDYNFGKIKTNIYAEDGDFIVWRAEKFASYQLAVVVDDMLQNVTEIVRGKDLLFQTAKQIFLQQILCFKNISYFHIPLILENNDQKMSKSNFSLPILEKNKREIIFKALFFLGFNCDTLYDLKNESYIDLLSFAINNFNKIKLNTESKNIDKLISFI